MSHGGRVQYTLRNKITLQLLNRIFCRNSSLQAVCDTLIARMRGCVSSLRIKVVDSNCNYSVAVRVNRVMSGSLCAERIKPVSEEDKM